MDTIIESLPRTGRVEINVNVSAEMNFTAYAAQRRVSRYVADEISVFMRGGEPSLVVSDRVYWRVPIEFSLPDRGLLGPVGTLDLDVETGQLRINSGQIEEIKRRAEDLASRPPWEMTTEFCREDVNKKRQPWAQ